jgi:hypothetical protein
MQFADPQDLSTAYLILRHVYDGDAIDWPIADDHPLREVFAALEAQGYVARWDRMWPLRDRYRLTDQGIAAIEAVYRPAGAQFIYDDVRRRNLDAAQRRAYLAQQGYDPLLWPLLHDPSTRWDTWRQDRGQYHDWFWDDQQPYQDRIGYVDPDDVAPQARPQRTVPYVVDLDREARASGRDAGAGSVAADHDVS